MSDEDWRRQAACRGKTFLFFPIGEVETPQQQADREAAARKYCERCPVMATCLNWALENDEYGFWGGKTLAERREMMAVAPKRPVLRPEIEDDFAYTASEWRVLESRTSISGRQVELRVRDTDRPDAFWAGVEWAVFEDGRRIFSADNEPDAWIFLYSAEIS